MAADPEGAPPARSGGKCERGNSPFHKTTTTNRNSPPRAFGRARELRFPSQERLGVGSPDPSRSCSGVSARLSPHSGSPSCGRRGVGFPDLPQPLLLRGLRAALAALRKRGAKRRAVRGRGARLSALMGRFQSGMATAPRPRTARRGQRRTMCGSRVSRSRSARRAILGVMVRMMSDSDELLEFWPNSRPITGISAIPGSPLRLLRSS